MTKADLLKLARSGGKISNQRIKRLKDADMTSSTAYNALPAKTRKAGKFAVNDKANKDVLINQILAERQFIRNKYSTVSEWKKFEKQVLTEYGKTYKNYVYDKSGNIVPKTKRDKANTLTRKQLNAMWNAVHKLKQAAPAKFNNYGGSDAVAVMVTRYMKQEKLKGPELIAKAKQELQEEYERVTIEENETMSVILKKGNGTKF